MKYAVVSDIGKRRKFNQDSYCIEENLFVVADGMGGHNGGDTASKIAVDVLSGYSAECKISPKVALESAIDEANKAIRNQAFDNPELEGMGTTIVACFISDNNIAKIANVGDSRAYHITADGMKQLTVDHSVVQELIERGMITKDEANSHPQKNVITRAVGSDNGVEVDFFEQQLNLGDIVLLCSDGLTTMIDEDSVLGIIRQNGTLEQTAQKLVDAANEAGGNDNITVLLIQV